MRLLRLRFRDKHCLFPLFTSTRAPSDKRQTPSAWHSGGLCRPPVPAGLVRLRVCFHQRPHLSGFTSACAPEPSWLRSTSRARLLIGDLCHASPAFSLALLAVSKPRLSRTRNMKWLCWKRDLKAGHMMAHSSILIDINPQFARVCMFPRCVEELFLYFTGCVSTAKCQKGSLRLTDFDILH